ncbi:signal peptide peptidase SppA [Consotaella aegiceratis]|uniref:signal peptide peptidase SppA n=1 Tax=Consotaella aegiceratis TaxID=3097961 RepID=UPI002F427FAF
MASDLHDLLDRRWLRRKLTFWRIAAVTILVLAVIAIALALRLPGGGGLGRDQIARVSIEGVITEDRKLIELMEDLKDDPKVHAVILRIDSPGGTTVGGETLFTAARALATAKPVVAEVGGLAASAGYMIASAADHIVARHTSIVGSIGVLFQYVDASDLLNTIGVDVKAVKSAPLKAEPSPFHPSSPEAEAMIRRLVMDTYEWFVALVAERRGMSEAEARALADGSIFTGDQGLGNRLVDAIGGEAEIRAWLEGEKGVPEGLDIIDRKPVDKDSWSIFGASRSALFAVLGLDPGAESLTDAIIGPGRRLDGLVSLWQLP